MDFSLKTVPEACEPSGEAQRDDGDKKPKTPTSAGAFGTNSGLPHALAEAALDAAVGVLQRRPDLVTALQQLLAPASPSAGSAAAFMSIAQYAAHRCVSERSIRYDLETMEEGAHFHRACRKSRRIVIHVQEADAWHAQRARKLSPVASMDELAVDEVTRRRARVALKKARGK